MLSMLLYSKKLETTRNTMFLMLLLFLGEMVPPHHSPLPSDSRKRINKHKTLSFLFVLTLLMNKALIPLSFVFFNIMMKTHIDSCFLQSSRKASSSLEPVFFFSIVALNTLFANPFLACFAVRVFYVKGRLRGWGALTPIPLLEDAPTANPGEGLIDPTQQWPRRSL